MINHLQYFLLILNMIDVLALNNIDFLHGLDSHLLIFILFQPSQFDITKGTYMIVIGLDIDSYY